MCRRRGLEIGLLELAKSGIWLEEEKEEEEIVETADVEADFERSRQLVRRIETERKLEVIREARDIAKFENELYK